MSIWNYFSQSKPTPKPTSLSPKPVSKPLPPKPTGIFNLDKMNPERKSSLNPWQFKSALKRDKGKIPGTSRGFKTAPQRLALAKELYERQKRYHLGTDIVMSPQRLDIISKKMDKERYAAKAHGNFKAARDLEDKVKYIKSLVQGTIKK
jgi:hypothetical protein